MIENLGDFELVDRYVRNQLSAEDEADFELRMLQSKELQQHLQAALGIKETFKLDERTAKSSTKSPVADQSRLNFHWKDMAIAASVLIAVITSAGLVVSQYQSNRLEDKIAELNQPPTSVLVVPVQIMRSSKMGSSKVLVAKPSGRTLIQLDIELSRKAQAIPLLQFTLINDGQESLLRWQASPSASGRATVLLRNDQVPVGRMLLNISDNNGNVLEHHMLEFR